MISILSINTRLAVKAWILGSLATLTLSFDAAAADRIWVSPLGNGTFNGLAYTDDDILEYQPSTGQWSIVFDGSAFGITADINAVTVAANGAMLFSIAQPARLGELGLVDDSDLVSFMPDTPGDFTAGSLSMFMDGSDVGLTTSAEDITAVAEKSDGSLLISVRGRFAADELVAADEDILLFQPTQTGTDTQGTWSLYLDGSTQSLTTSAENIWGISEINDGLALTTLGTFSVTGSNGNGADILQCLTNSQPPLECEFGDYNEYADAGFNRTINALHIDFSPTVPTPPTSEDDHYTAIESTPLVVTTANGVLANDTTSESENTTVTSVRDPENGMVSLAPDGGFEYLPNPGFVGVDSFIYSATNSIGTGNLALVSINVVGDPATNPLFANRILVSAIANGTVNGLSYTDDDVIAYDLINDTWQILFDGSAFGISADINAISITSIGNLLFSLAQSQNVPGLGVIDDSDLLLFTPESPTDFSNGTLSHYFDGSDVELTTGGEDITAVSALPDGGLAISVRGTFIAGGVSARDEDVVLFTPLQTGPDTSGSWSLLFDGSQNSLSTSAENIGGLAATDDYLLLNTLGNFSVPDATGNRNSILQCLSLDRSTVSSQCTYSVLDIFPGDELNRNINALHTTLSPAVPVPPTSVADDYNVVQDTALSVATEDGVLANDVDVTFNTFVEQVDSPLNGTLTLSADGSFTYTPFEGFTGTDSFTYIALNNDGNSAPASVQLVVEAAPTFDDQFITHLSFDEGAGPPLDSSEAGNNGTLSGNLQYTTETPDGSLYSLLFDGSDSRVALDELPAIQNGLTLAAWVNASSFTGSARDGRIISTASGLSANAHYTVLSTISSGSTAQFRFRAKINGTTQTLQVTNAAMRLDTGVWYHIAATYDGNTMRIYQNGIEVASRQVSGTLTPATGVSTAIGSQPDGNRPWHGFIDDVRVLDYALDESAIAGIYDQAIGSIASDDNYSTLIDTVLVVDAPGVLDNDDDLSNLGLSATLFEPPLFGQLLLLPDGGFTYTPATGFAGTDTFRYGAIQSDGTTKVATVTLNVIPVDTPRLAFTTGSVEFTKAVVDDTVDNTHYAGAADYNADGLPDLIGTDYVDDTVFLYQQQIDGSFVRQTLDASLDGAYPAHNGDIDKDGDIDIMAGGYNDDTLALYINNGNGQFSRQVVDGAADGIHSMEIVDLDQDGDNDILSALQDAGDIVWYENTGGLNFVRRTVDPLMSKAKRATFADFDSDGDTDIVAAADGVDRIAWYENDGNQNFTRRIVDNNLGAAYFVHTEDMNADGFSDIVAAGKSANQIVLYINRTDGTFHKTILDSQARGARSTFVADIDADGRPDALGTGLQADTVAWYRNNGNNSYTRYIIDTAADGAYGVSSHDVDGDADEDVLLASRDDFTITVYYNDRVHLFTVPTSGSVALTQTALNTVAILGAPASEIVYRVTLAPNRGDLTLNGQSLQVSGTFTQADINTNALTYQRTDGTLFEDTAGVSVTINGSAASALSTKLRFTISN